MSANSAGFKKTPKRRGWTNNTKTLTTYSGKEPLRFDSFRFRTFRQLIGSFRKITFPGSTRFGLRFSDASWLGLVRFGSFSPPVPAGSRLNGSVRFSSAGSVRFLIPSRWCWYFGAIIILDWVALPALGEKQLRRYPMRPSLVGSLQSSDASCCVWVIGCDGCRALHRATFQQPP